MSKFSWCTALTLGVLALPISANAQERGTVTGRVVDAQTQQPLSEVQVVVAGTNSGSLTNAQGIYRIETVEPGRVELRASRIGYRRGVQQVTVGAGAVATANFSLEQSAVELEAIVVTATGQLQAKRELGNSVGTINVEQNVPKGAVTSASQVLQARSPGVSVLQASGTSGSGSRIRIRGSASVSLSNDPLLIIDGARADISTSSSIGAGGQAPTRFDDLNPDAIESIEILKGPAASALYGTAAANGVIIVTTKKGVSGATQFRAYTEQGVLQQNADYPGVFRGVDTDGSRCLIALDGPCAEIKTFNPLEDPRSTPFEDGYRQKYGISASGGNDATTFFLSGELEDENGAYKFDANWLDRVNVRANVAGELTDNLDFSVSSGYMNSDLKRPQNDNNILGLLSGGLLSFATEFNEARCGFLVACPEKLAQIETRQQAERINASSTMNFRPISWLSIVGTVGLDRLNRFDNETIPPGVISFGSLPEGERTSNRAQISTYTANLSGTTNYDLTSGVSASTSVGGQYFEEIFRQTSAFGARLLAGAGSLEGTTARFAVGESNQQIRTIGAFVQQQVTINDRLYLTGALRADDNSAFGADFGLITYPSLSASWVVAEEPWFPEITALSMLRLRGAVGQSGLRPGQNDAITFLSPVAVTEGTQSVPGFTVGGTGNLNLEPERTTEYELGFDAGLLDDRVGVELTYYNSTSEDALISRRLPLSLGLSSSRFENLGEVKNQGLEVLLNTNLVDTRRVRWSITTSASWNENELVDLGQDPVTGEDIPEIIFGLGGNSQRHAEGTPLGGYYGTPYTYSDENSDGIIQPGEVVLDEDGPTFLGNAFPTREISFQSSLDLFQNITISGLLDHRGGHKMFNSTEEFRCGAFFTCQSLYDADRSLEDQAAAVASAFHNSHFGYIEDADFWKLRELSVRFAVPENISRRFGAPGLAVTLAGRNLATWTDYKGLDPEINFAGQQTNFSTAEFLTQPPLRFWSARVDVNF
jgi:TonB-linked SusC/RagA family outer membrane protein